jgi:hypothetical protein
MVTSSRFQACAAAAVLFLTVAATGQAKYSGGMGEPNDPYQIATAADLIALGETPADYDKHFILTAEIDLAPNLPGRKVFDKAVIGTLDGIFDGNGHRISHLTIKGGKYLGLFGELRTGADLRNLAVVDVNIVGSGYFVAGLVGYNAGTVADCYSTSAIAGNSSVGGLMGYNAGTLTRCYSTGVVSGTQTTIGGIAGLGVRGGVGGLAGYNAPKANVTQCYSTGAVSGCDYVGGLVGRNAGTITDSYAKGPVAGVACTVGGLVGENYDLFFTMTDWVEVVPGAICNCYATGMVSGAGSVPGGLVGGGGEVTASFWDGQTSGRTTSEGGTAKTTAEMQTAKTFLDAAWDLVGETANGTDDTWGILEGKGYPTLAWEFYALSPDPQYEATDVVQSPILSWRAATRAVGHDVYFGDDKSVVAIATPESLGTYRGRQPRELTTFDPGVLKLNETYYWRIDEVNEGDPSGPWKGSVWSFTTADFIIVSVVDDFESYTDDEGSLIWETWVDGWYFDANHPGNGTRSSVGNVDPPFAEQTIVHAGWQSMPMDYNWDYNDVRPWYSEAERTWGTPQDWTVDGADALTLYFRGDPNNSPEPLYVGIEDSAGRMAMVVHPDAEAVLATEWQKWHIALGEVRAAGVDVAAVKKMVIGVGDRKNPQPGGTGRIYIDDIRLTKRMP